MTTETIDLTPTWAGMLPALLAVLEGGTDEGRDLARAELVRMAEIADRAQRWAAVAKRADALLTRLACEDGLTTDTNDAADALNVALEEAEK
jgi:hypothetical protein